MTSKPGFEEIISLIRNHPDAMAEMIRDDLRTRLATQAARRGAPDPEATARAITRRWPAVRFVTIYARGLYRGGFHRHEEIAGHLGLSPDQVYRHWKALYDEEFLAEDGRTAVRLFDATNLKYGNDGCLFRFDDDPPFDDASLDRIVSTNESLLRRHTDMLWTTLAEIVLRAQVERARARKARALARRLASQIAQLQLPLGAGRKVG